MPEVFQSYKCCLRNPCSYMYACLFIDQCKICSICGETTLVLLFSPFKEGCLQLLQKKLPEEIICLILIIFSVFEKRLLFCTFIIYLATDCSLYNEAMNLFFQMDALRKLKFPEGQCMVDNYRPPTPLHQRTVRASFRESQPRPSLTFAPPPPGQAPLTIHLSQSLIQRIPAL